MVPAVPNRQLVTISGKRIKSRPSRLAMIPGAVSAVRKGEMKKDEREAMLRAKLMSAAKCGIYVSDEVPPGQFTIIDPEPLAATERLMCPFKVKTLVVHPNDIEQAIEHFEGTKKAS